MARMNSPEGLTAEQWSVLESNAEAARSAPALTTDSLYSRYLQRIDAARLLGPALLFSVRDLPADSQWLLQVQQVLELSGEPADQTLVTIYTGNYRTDSTGERHAVTADDERSIEPGQDPDDAWTPFSPFEIGVALTRLEAQIEAGITDESARTFIRLGWAALGA